MQVAHDTAGLVAAKLALAHPTRVRSLHLLDAPLDAGASSLLPLWILWLPGAPHVLANLPIALTAWVLRRCRPPTIWLQPTPKRVSGQWIVGICRISAMLDSAVTAAAPATPRATNYSGGQQFAAFSDNTVTSVLDR